MSKIYSSHYNVLNKKNQNQKAIDKIYVISLKKHDKQRKLIKKYFDKYNIDFVFFDGIDGYQDPAILELYNDYVSWSFDDTRTHPTEKKYKRKIIKSPGAIGLLKTYQKIIETNINNKNINNILIFEDDVLLDKDFKTKLSTILNKQKDIDVLYLGCSQHVWKEFDFIFLDPLSEVSLYKAPVIIDGSFATIFNKKSFPILLDTIKKNNAPIDLCMRELVEKLKCYVACPNIAIADTTRKSSISNLERNLREHKHKVKWETKNIDFSRGILKVSIIIANYNNEKTIGFTLDSVKKQTYGNYEIMLVDDASTDSSIKIIKNWISKNPDVDIKLIENKNNIGAYASRNICVKESSGFFITILDSDDVFLPIKLEYDVYNYFNYEKNEIFFSTMYRSQNIEINLFNDTSHVLKAISEERKSYDKLNNYPWNYKFRFGFPTIFVEKTFFEKYGYWNDNYRFGMDVELVQRYIIKKYNQFLNHKETFNMIYTNKCEKYGIHLSDFMSYVSTPMNENNATNICQSIDRENIHAECNKKLLNLLR